MVYIKSVEDRRRDWQAACCVSVGFLVVVCLAITNLCTTYTGSNIDIVFIYIVISYVGFNFP